MQIKTDRFYFIYYHAQGMKIVVQDFSIEQKLDAYNMPPTSNPQAFYGNKISKNSR